MFEDNLSNLNADAIKLIEKLNQESYQKKLITELKDLKKKLNNHDGTMGSILLHWLSKQPSL